MFGIELAFIYDMSIKPKEYVHALTMDDLDNNGSNEIIFISSKSDNDNAFTYVHPELYIPILYKIYVFNTNSSTPHIEWGQKRHDNNATSTYTP